MSINTANGPMPVSFNKSLHKMVKLAAGNQRLTAVERHSIIINEVSPAVRIETNEAILATLLNELLSAIVSNTNHGCIRIEAKEYEDIIFVIVKDNSGIVSSAVATDLDAIKALARKMNGTITITNTDNQVNSFLLSFPNFKLAA